MLMWTWGLQTNENEVVAASIVYLSNIASDGPTPLETVFCTLI